MKIKTLLKKEKVKHERKKNYRGTIFFLCTFILRSFDLLVTDEDEACPSYTGLGLKCKHPNKDLFSN